MSVFSNSAVSSVLFGHGGGVSAWAMVSNHAISSGSAQGQFDMLNYIDGYNLYLDVQSTNANYYGGLKFSFIEPMPHNKYKIFVSGSLSTYPPIVHVLNNSIYPKTTTSFWIRSGLILPSSGLNPPSVAGRTVNHATTLNLWSNGTSNLSVVVYA